MGLEALSDVFQRTARVCLVPGILGGLNVNLVAWGCLHGSRQSSRRPTISRPRTTEASDTAHGEGPAAGPTAGAELGPRKRGSSCINCPDGRGAAGREKKPKIHPHLSQNVTLSRNILCVHYDIVRTLPNQLCSYDKLMMMRMCRN